MLLLKYPFLYELITVSTNTSNMETLLTKYLLETYGPSTTKSGRVKEVLVRESK